MTSECCLGLDFKTQSTGCSLTSLFSKSSKAVRRVRLKLLPLNLAALVILGAGKLYGQAGTIDLTALANYANQPKPAYIIKDNSTPGNTITDAGATLGRVLFYDKRLSVESWISCSSCHQQAHAFSDPALASSGVGGSTSRHAMRLINSRFAQEIHYFWDQRAATLEEQTTQPIQNEVEMGFSGANGLPSLNDLLNRLMTIPEYRILFNMAFGNSTSIDQFHLQRALAQFVHSIQSFDSKYDAGRAVAGSDGVPFSNFTASENNGKRLFLVPPGPQGGAGCAGCHRPPEFDIDPASHNNGVIGAIGGGTDLTNTRSPSLRDLLRSNGQLNGPFMHNGGFTNLDQVVSHYNAIPADNPNLDARLRTPNGNLQNLNLTQQQKNDLVAFLATLSGTNVYTDARWSTPFDASDQLSLVVLGNAQVTKNGDGTATLSCKVAPGLQYIVQSCATLPQWQTIGPVTVGQDNVLRFTASLANTAFYRFALVMP